MAAALRATGVALLILGTGLALAVGGLLLAFAPRWRRRLRENLFIFASRTALWLLRVDLRVSGPLPRPPFLLVTNHLSYLDILVLASRARCLFVAKTEVRDWPLLGPICRGFGTIFIDREDRRDIPRVLGEIETALERGEGVVIFPEGTSSPGATVEPFHSPLLALPARRGMPVHAAALSYQTPDGEPPAHLAVCWWGEGELLPHLAGLFRLSRIDATLDCAPAPVVGADRKILAERLRAVVDERFRPTLFNSEGFRRDLAEARAGSSLPPPATPGRDQTPDSGPGFLRPIPRMDAPEAPDTPTQRLGSPSPPHKPRSAARRRGRGTVKLCISYRGHRRPSDLPFDTSRDR